MKHHFGSIEVVAGSMFSGKTEELIRRLRRATIAKQKVQVFKPKIDNRYAITEVASHDGSKFKAQPIAEVKEIWDLLEDETTVVGLDEAQFFDEEIAEIASQLSQRGIRIIAAGLDMDFRGEPFGVMPKLMAIAENVRKLQAICVVCGEPAYCTQRLVNGKPAHYNDPIVIVGADEMYEARCRQHHAVPRE
jgi:thymidine kinase